MVKVIPLAAPQLGTTGGPATCLGCPSEPPPRSPPIPPPLTIQEELKTSYAPEHVALQARPLSVASASHTTVAASAASGCRLRHTGLQPRPHRGAACVTCGCRLHHPRLQAASPTVAGATRLLSPAAAAALPDAALRQRPIPSGGAPARHPQLWLVGPHRSNP